MLAASALASPSPLIPAASSQLSCLWPPPPTPAPACPGPSPVRHPSMAPHHLQEKAHVPQLSIERPEPVALLTLPPPLPCLYSCSFSLALVTLWVFLPCPRTFDHTLLSSRSGWTKVGTQPGSTSQDIPFPWPQRLVLGWAHDPTTANKSWTWDFGWNSGGEDTFVPQGCWWPFFHSEGREPA